MPTKYHSDCMFTDSVDLCSCQYRLLLIIFTAYESLCCNDCLFRQPVQLQYEEYPFRLSVFEMYCTYLFIYFIFCTPKQNQQAFCD